MTVGSNNPLGSALNGEFEVKQQVLATDILTITGATSQSGDFFNCRVVGGTEKFSVDVNGNVVIAGYNTTKHATTTIALTDLATNGGLGVGILTGTAQFYFRQNGTLYRIAGTAA